MSLEYTKRLLELRDYPTKELTGQSTKEDSITSLVSKPMEDDVEEINPLEKIQTLRPVYPWCDKKYLRN